MIPNIKIDSVQDFERRGMWNGIEPISEMQLNSEWMLFSLKVRKSPWTT